MFLKSVLSVVCLLLFSGTFGGKGVPDSEFLTRRSFAKFVIDQAQIDFSELGSPERFGVNFANEITSRLEKSPFPIFIDGVVGYEVQPFYGAPTGDDNQRVHIVRLHKDKGLNSLEHWLSVMIQLDRIDRYESYNNLYMKFVMREITDSEFHSNGESLDLECLVETATYISNSRDLASISAGTSPMLDSMRKLAAGQLGEERGDVQKLYEQSDFRRMLAVYNTDSSLSIVDRLRLIQPRQPVPEHNPIFGEKMLRQFLESRPDLKIDTDRPHVVYEKVASLLNARQKHGRVLLINQPKPMHQFTRPPRFAEGTGFDAFIGQNVVTVREDQELTALDKWLLICMEILRTRQISDRTILSLRLMKGELSPEQYVESLYELDCNAFKEAHKSLREVVSMDDAFYLRNPMCFEADRIDSGKIRNSKTRLPQKLDRQEEYLERVGIVR